MINLLPKKPVSSDLYKSTQRLVTLASTITLVVYILIIAGMLGWGYYLSLKDQTLANEITDLTAKVKKLQVREAMMLQVGARQKAIDAFVAKRPPVVAQIKIVNNHFAPIEVTAWDYKADGTGRISISGNSILDLQDYTQLLRQKYKTVIADQAAAKGGKWNLNLQTK